MNDVDVAELLADLRRGVNEQNEVIARRTSPEVTAQTLLDLTSEIYQWADSNGTSHDTNTFPTWQPVIGSPAHVGASDLEISIASFIEQHSPMSGIWLDTNPTRNLMTWSMEVVRRCLLTTLDSLAGAAALMPRPGHSRAPIILGRSALEATAIVANLIHPEIDALERNRRLINLRLSEIHEAGSDDGQTSNLGDMVNFAQHIGLPTKRPKNRWTAPFVPGSNGRPDSSAQAIERALPSIGRDFWRSQSAVAHSRATAMLVADEFAAPHSIDPGRQAESASFNMLPSVLVLAEMLPDIAAFTGWDAFRGEASIQRCYQAMSSCAGLHDEAIRSDLGFTSDEVQHQAG